MRGDSIRLLRLITRLNIGGPARQALTLTKELRPDFETTLACGTPSMDEGELSDPDVSVVRVPLRRALAPSADLSVLRAVRKLIADQKPAIIHTHMAKAGSLGRLASVGMQKPPRLVHTFHGHVLQGYFSKPVQTVFSNAERYLARRTDVLVAVSTEIRDDLLKMGIGTEDQWRVIPLGFDLHPMLRVQGRTGALRDRLGLGEAPLVGVVGRLAPIKDHRTLIEAVARLHGVHLAIVGDGEMRSELEDFVSNRGIQKRVHFIGWSLDVPGVVADMDVVALTSRNEGTPVSLIEASACARPVVATDVGGVKAVVQDGTSGILVPAGDASAVAAGLERLLGDPELGERMGAAGREHVRERFTSDRLVCEIRSLYLELLRR